MKEYNSNPDDKATGWVRKITMKEAKNGFKCQLWQRKNEVKGKPDWVRIELQLHNISDPDWMPKYMTNPNVEESAMVKEFRCTHDNGEADRNYYFRFKLPMMTDRDNICNISVDRRENGLIFLTMRSIEHPDFPPLPNVVRNFQNITGIVKPHPSIPKCWDYCEIDQLDMKGSFPSRLFNMIMASSCKAEMEKMYRCVKDKN